MLSASGSLRIWYTSIRIRNWSNLNPYLYPRLSVFESESYRKCENKYNIDNIRPYPIHLHPYYQEKAIDGLARQVSGAILSSSNP